MEIVKWHKAKFEKNSLLIDESVSIDEWKELGQNLRQIEGCVQFWIGDWARFGDKKGFTGKYTDPKVYDELEEITGLERQTIRVYKSISENVDTNQRLTDLSFNHHREVAKLTPEKQELFLQKASDEKLSVRSLRSVIKKDNFNTKKAEFEKDIKPENKKQIILEGDCLDVLRTLENNKYDLLLSDPPYGMDFKSGWSDKIKIQNDKINDTISLFENALKHAVPLLKDDAHFYLFGSIQYINEIRPIIEKYLNLKNILIWDRGVIGMGDLKTYGYSYDIVYFGYNSKWKDLNGTRDKDILNFDRVSPNKMIHPTEKPLDLLEYIIKKSTKENDNVLDPFAGGGSTLLACKNTNREATGIEIENEYYELIKSRL
jgi:site-specific DNA-methyltransferase (adenine-specific)